MFEKEYFEEIYDNKSLIDGDYNAKEHASYIASLFELMEIEVDSLVDFGFGKGNLLKSFSKKFKPSHIEGCDVSKYSLKKLEKKKWAEKLHLKSCAIHEFRSKRRFHLGLCNSVLQYVPSRNLEASIKNMAYYCQYLYLHLPTKEDYKILKEHFSFEDPYAKQRPKEQYKKILSRYFTTVSYGLMESKAFPQKETPFYDSLFRL